ncbi:FAD-dependent oxidoreductase [Streptomyces sp. NPDC059861]|uniref:FAD-dependent oxidoreductase n=1 Tax=Streptomyces sp. NPDC059861 TaxID=3346974 RepID=UPI00365F525D
MTEQAASHASYWLDTVPPGEPAPPPAGDLQVDVAVIGAGIAGLSTAWELTRRGHGVAVLEADRIAAGVTGHTTAKLSAQHTLIYDRLRRTRGVDGARLYARSQTEAIHHAADIVRELGIACDWEDTAAYTFAQGRRRVPELRAEAEAASEAGLTAGFVTETDLPFPVEGAVRVADQAQFHPRKYLLALADAVRAGGGQLYEGTRVTGLTEGEPCVLTTQEGTRVTARAVVVATHYPIFDRALLFTRLSPRRELVIAAPVEAAKAPTGMYITPEHRTRSVRTAPYADGKRLLIVTGEHFTPGSGKDTEELFATLTGWAERHFGTLHLSHRWATQDNDSTDHVPLVGPLHPASHHVYVATGFGGWGLSGGIMAGRLLCDEITGGEAPPWSELYDPRRIAPVLREGGQFIRHQATVARHFVGDRLPGLTRPGVDDLAPGDGAVVHVGGRRCAVHRDEDGRLHAVSARCTHLGCLVAFNRAEQAWECPCHGSRFAPDGQVLQGPAVRPLERRDL